MYIKSTFYVINIICIKEKDIMNVGDKGYVVIDWTGKIEPITVVETDMEWNGSKIIKVHHDKSLGSSMYLESEVFSDIKGAKNLIKLKKQKAVQELQDQYNTKEKFMNG